MECAKYSAFSLTWPESMQIYLNKGKRLQKKKFNSHGTGLKHQHGRRFIVLEHQYSRPDVTCENALSLTRNLSSRVLTIFHVKLS